MSLSLNKIAVIGTGVIGSGWVLRMLAKKKIIHLFEPNISQRKFLLNEISRTKKSIKKYYKISKLDTKNLHFKSSIKEAVTNVGLIQENVPENLKIKKQVIKEISNFANPQAIIASSSSGLLPSKIQNSCKLPGRFLIAHPFNPVYLIPLVEIVKGSKTNKKFIKKSESFYKSLGMIPLTLKKEVEGYLSDRLQESMWRESLHILNKNLATTDDLDKAIIHGPGLRWSLMGIFLTFHLAGGKLGMKHMLEQFGPALKLPWTELKAPKLTVKLSNKIIKETKKQTKGKSIKKLTNIRDNFLIDLLKLKKKYKLV
tara:strand:- start:2626 stop:3564 length:939 start_codon:yes stop_codon:yes gene_type:complete